GFPGPFRESEVQHLYVSLRRDFDVAGLQIAMNDSFFVRRRQRLRYLNGQVERLGNRERTAQHLPVHQLQHQEDQVARFLESINSGNVGVIQGREYSRFVSKTSQPRRLAREFVWERLDGDIAAEFVVVRTIDLSHAARTDEGDHAVGPEL